MKVRQRTDEDRWKRMKDTDGNRFKEGGGRRTFRMA